MTLVPCDACGRYTDVPAMPEHWRCRRCLAPERWEEAHRLLFEAGLDRSRLRHGTTWFEVDIAFGAGDINRFLQRTIIDDLLDGLAPTTRIPPGEWDEFEAFLRWKDDLCGVRVRDAVATA